MARPSDLKLVRRMMEKGLHEEALEIVRMMEELENEKPQQQATAFELDFLISLIRSQGVPVAPSKMEKLDREEEDEDRDPVMVPVAWSKVSVPTFASLEDHEKWFAVRGNPRLASLLAGGELPSLQAYKEGRRP